MKKPLKWAIPAVAVLVVILAIIAFIRTTGTGNDPDAELERMLPAEREFCEKVLWQINSRSSERDVLALLGTPSRDLKLKKNWWVELGGRKDRVGVYFNTFGFATQVVLAAGSGRFYYRRKVTDHETRTPEGFGPANGADTETSAPSTFPRGGR